MFVIFSKIRTFQSGLKRGRFALSQPFTKERSRTNGQRLAGISRNSLKRARRRTGAGIRRQFTLAVSRLCKNCNTVFLRTRGKMGAAYVRMERVGGTKRTRDNRDYPARRETTRGALFDKELETALPQPPNLRSRRRTIRRRSKQTTPAPQAISEPVRMLGKLHVR